MRNGVSENQRDRDSNNLPAVTFHDESCFSRTWRYTLAIFLSLVVGLGAGYFVGRVIHTERDDTASYSHPYPLLGRRDPPSVFSPLSMDEMKSILDYCLETNITKKYHPKAKLLIPFLKRNKIISLSVMIPSKEAVLSYLDENGPYPGRYARVYVDKAQEVPPYFVEYQIGPLRQPKMTHKVLRIVTNHERRPRSSQEALTVQSVASLEFSKLNDLFMKCFDGGSVSAVHHNDKSLRVFVSSVSSQKGRKSVVFLGIPGRLSTSDILPISATVSHASLDWEEWKVHDIFFFRQGPFVSVDELLDAYNNGSLTLFTLPKGYIDHIKTSRDYSKKSNQPLRKNASKRPPKTVEPQGPRYKVTDYLVEWMGWSLELSMNNYHGPSIFNIRYKGERIVYENSLNDITLLYSSLNPGAGSTLTVLSDMIFRLGSFPNIIQSLDCPEHATILNVTTFSEGRQIPSLREGICVFEADGQRPLWRHNGRINSGMNDNYLNIRIPLGLGNYDYMIDFQFHLDGKIWTYATAYGSLYTAFWFKDDDTVGSKKSRTQFGNRVAEHSMGSIHDHLFAFKVDIDVAGRTNTFEKIHWRGGTISEAIRSQTNRRSSDIPGVTSKFTRYLEYETLSKEKGLVVESKPVVWSIINENKQNKWGNFLGVKIEHTQEYQEVLPPDHPALIALPHMKYNLAVSKHHDDEQFIDSFQYDKQRLHDPIHNLESFLDDEDIVNSDLVTWISVHFLHLPSAEDFPMTTGATRGFLIQPMNFFGETATFDMPQYDIYKNGTIVNDPYSIHKHHYVLPDDIDRPDYA
ncbi:membrane primary amine oxidase-like [Saccostrea cucullata]|uniref:membrane primary amine oxidase-like n=1 Tax=Saccostrea cuccullata TaxID=36930 RepID=UPI002ED468F9